MAGLASGIFARNSRAQYAAIVRMRLQMLRHGLRKSRGVMELVSQLINWAVLLIWGLGLGTGFGFLAYFFLSNNQQDGLEGLLWGLLFLWQLLPITAVSFRSESFDLSSLLRFPMGYSVYYVLTLLTGLVDMSTILGSAGLIGIAIGAGIAKPAVLTGLIPALVLFGIFNIFLTRAILAWLDRWLAKRRSREVIGACFFLLIIALEFLNPAFHRHDHGHAYEKMVQSYLLIAAHDTWWSPPGLVMMGTKTATLTESLIGLMLFMLLAGWLLGLRLHQQYLGENLSEVAARPTKAVVQKDKTAGFSPRGPLGAIFVKELKYLTSSYQFLFSLVIPLILVYLLSATRQTNQSPLVPQHYVLAFGILYAFLGLTRMLFNSLGTDSTGVSFYLTSPVPLRTVMLGKNIFHAVLLIVEITLIWGFSFLCFGLPDLKTLVVAICTLLFAAPLEFAIANIISIHAPYPVNFSKLGRMPGSGTNSLYSLLSMVIVGALATGIYLLALRLGNLWYAALIFVVLSEVSSFIYKKVLGQVDTLIRQRSEALLSELTRLSS